jgi:putative ABC transport system substrate-binding protein
MGDVFTGTHHASIISAAARNNVPAVYGASTVARDGGLLSYGIDSLDLLRRAASYVDRILRGENPGDLPVQFPTKFEMVLNLKTDCPQTDASAASVASARTRDNQNPDNRTNS